MNPHLKELQKVEGVSGKTLVLNSENIDIETSDNHLVAVVGIKNLKIKVTKNYTIIGHKDLL